MTILTINNKEFEMPEGWNELTFRNFIDMMVVRSDEQNSHLDNFIKCLAAICKNEGIEKELNDLLVDDFKVIQEAFLWLISEPKINSKTTTNKFKILLEDGTEEMWTIKKEFAKLTIGEAVSLELMLKDKRIDLLPIELGFGILMRRLDKDGNPEPFDADKLNLIINDYSRKIMLQDVYDTLTFFLNGGQTSCSISSKVTFKKKTEKRTKVKTKTPMKTVKTRLINGLGTQLSTS